MSSEKCKLKQQEYYNIAIWTAKKHNTETPNANKIQRIKKSHSLLMGMQNDTVTLEESLAVSYKTKHMLIQPINCASCYL